MSLKFPELVEPWRAADTSARYTGRLQVTDCPRLAAAVLEADRSEISFELAFARDDTGRATVTGSVRTRLVLRCQRCMKALDHEIDAALSVAFVTGLDEAEQLPERYEPWWVTERFVRVRDLIEDEALLGLPQIPLHATGLCAPDYAPSEVPEATEAAEANPFAALAAWKERQEG